MEDGFNYQTAIEEFQDERPVWKQIWAAIITEFTPDKKNWFGAAFSFVLALILTIIIARSEETVSLAGKICGILLDVEIALFGCVFAVYSILLAFLSDEYVKKLLEIDYYRQTNYLRKSTKYYEAALFIYFVAIGISLVYKLTIECMPQNFALINSELANEIVAGVLLFPYFAYSLRTIYELKSIVGNTLLLFRASIQYKIIAFVKEDKEEKRKAEEGVGIKYCPIPLIHSVQFTQEEKTRRCVSFFLAGERSAAQTVPPAGGN